MGRGRQLCSTGACLDSGQNQVSVWGGEQVGGWLVAPCRPDGVGGRGLRLGEGRGGWEGGWLVKQTDGIDVNSSRLASNQSIGFGPALACRNREVRSRPRGIRCEVLSLRRSETVAKVRCLGALGADCRGGTARRTAFSVGRVGENQRREREEGGERGRLPVLSERRMEKNQNILRDSAGTCLTWQCWQTIPCLGLQSARSRSPG